MSFCMSLLAKCFERLSSLEVQENLICIFQFLTSYAPNTAYNQQPHDTIFILMNWKSPWIIGVPASAKPTRAESWSK